MTLPMNFTLVRHGLSEANRIQKYMHDSDLKSLEQLLDPSFVTRHDSTARLTREGVEQQQQVTGCELTSQLLTDSMSPLMFALVKLPLIYALKVNGLWMTVGVKETGVKCQALQKTSKTE